ncbi:hypothetical protein HNY73_015426 [Argiope bruennichi]|uniref:Peptidase aspartic putative domain-containing protein n=1 Tax=Argiope bruennichi TaxID=94029 RepID=A0A8T0ES93_ARGBR|nr:hypothetical protein HNY73_015426 [Argiope bruennichi]
MPSNDLDRLLDFLQDEVEGEERIVLASQSFDQPKKSSFSNSRRESNEKKFQTRVSSATDLLASNLNKKKLCIFCTEEHNSWNCKKASKLTLHEKQSAVEKARCCFLCLREGHGVKTCRSKFNCQLCGKKHHLFLCRALSPEPNSSSVPTDIKVRESMIQHDEALANLSKCSNVFLQTLTILVRGETTKRKARAIIDSGSQRSYILKATAEEMNYKAKRREYLQHSLFGGSNTSTCQHDVYMIYLSSVSEEYSCHFEVLGQEVICDSILSRKRGSHFKELRDYNIHLAEDLDGPIEILIGADVAGKLITGNHLQLKNGITAIETKLGWTVIGRANSENTSLLITSMLTTSACITDLWTLDSLGITDPSEKKTAVELQEAARQHFLDTVKIENNRYIVSLPWIEDHLPLPDNFELSEKRLHKVVKRLKTEGLFEAYGAVFKEWLEEDIIEEVTKDESFYVDNCVTSVPNEKELELFIEVATNVMADRSFQLRGWESTCLKDRSAPVTNVLGLQWDKGLDTLGINMNSLKELCVENVTKKIILSTAHRIFDPIGATCPVALFPKLLLQKTWERKLNWEEEVDSNTREEFLKWMRDIFHLEKVQIPRHLKTGDANEKCSLHFFSDASMYAYAAVAFLRVETSEYVKVQLLSAKARVSPTGKKKTTIARLELLAATITARLASSITKEIPHEKIYLWSDSTTVIGEITYDVAKDVRAKVQQEQVTPKVQQEQAAHEVSQTRVLDPEGPISETVKTRSGRIVHGPKRLDL